MSYGQRGSAQCRQKKNRKERKIKGKGTIAQVNRVRGQRFASTRV